MPVDLPGLRRTPLTLTTCDGERLAALHLPRTDRSRELAVVLAHGFSGSLRKPAVRAVAAALAPYVGVLAFDFRGHGDSSGVSTLGDREIYDVDAAVISARRLGYRQVITCGFSMGGSTVLRHAALLRDVDAVVSVSAPSRWYVRDTPPMRRVHWLIERRLGRVVARTVMGTRIASGWDSPPEPPVEIVGRIAPIPLLLVHGDADRYFTVEHPRVLASAARSPTELWLEPGFGHAEAAIRPDLLARLGRHLPMLVSRAPAEPAPIAEPAAREAAGG